MFTYADADTELSPRMTLAAEGFLVCRDAVLARTGEQEYHAVEIPTLDADPGQRVSAEELQVRHVRALCPLL
jgi:hypothetical protein